MKTVNIYAVKAQTLVDVEATEAPVAGQTSRFGFLERQILIPNDFDRMGSEEIEQLFSGGR